MWETWISISPSGDSIWTICPGFETSKTMALSLVPTRNLFSSTMNLVISSYVASLLKTIFISKSFTVFTIGSFLIRSASHGSILPVFVFKNAVVAAPPDKIVKNG